MSKSHEQSAKQQSRPGSRGRVEHVSYKFAAWLFIFSLVALVTKAVLRDTIFDTRSATFDAATNRVIDVYGPDGTALVAVTYTMYSMFAVGAIALTLGLSLLVHRNKAAA